MIENLEHAIVVAAIVWGIVSLVKHFMPDFYSREELSIYTKFKDATTALEARIAALEEKLGVK